MPPVLPKARVALMTLSVIVDHRRQAGRGAIVAGEDDRVFILEAVDVRDKAFQSGQHRRAAAPERLFAERVEVLRAEQLDVLLLPGDQYRYFLAGHILHAFNTRLEILFHDFTPSADHVSGALGRKN